jgi:hypothetical protein
MRKATSRRSRRGQREKIVRRSTAPRDLGSPPGKTRATDHPTALMLAKSIRLRQPLPGDTRAALLDRRAALRGARKQGDHARRPPTGSFVATRAAGRTGAALDPGRRPGTDPGQGHTRAPHRQPGAAACPGQPVSHLDPGSHRAGDPFPRAGSPGGSAGRDGPGGPPPGGNPNGHADRAPPGSSGQPAHRDAAPPDSYPRLRQPGFPARPTLAAPTPYTLAPVPLQLVYVRDLVLSPGPGQGR